MMVKPMQAICENIKRTGTETYTGRLVQKKGKYELRIEADSAICPQMQCTFKFKFELKKK